MRDTSSQYGDNFCEIVVKSDLKTKLWAGQDIAASSCCDLDLQGSDPNFARDTSSEYGDHFFEIVVNYDLKKLWVGHGFTLRSSCDIDLQGSDPNVARAYCAHCYLFRYQLACA